VNARAARMRPRQASGWQVKRKRAPRSISDPGHTGNDRAFTAHGLRAYFAPLPGGTRCLTTVAWQRFTQTDAGAGGVRKRQDFAYAFPPPTFVFKSLLTASTDIPPRVRDGAQNSVGNGDR